MKRVTVFDDDYGLVTIERAEPDGFPWDPENKPNEFVFYNNFGKPFSPQKPSRIKMLLKAFGEVVC